VSGQEATSDQIHWKTLGYKLAEVAFRDLCEAIQELRDKVIILLGTIHRTVSFLVSLMASICHPIPAHVQLPLDRYA